MVGFVNFKSHTGIEKFADFYIFVKNHAVFCKSLPQVVPVVAGHLFGKTSFAVQYHCLVSFIRKIIRRKQRSHAAAEDDYLLSFEVLLCFKKVHACDKVHSGLKKAFYEGHVRKGSGGDDHPVRGGLLENPCGKGCLKPDGNPEPFQFVEKEREDIVEFGSARCFGCKG